MHESFCHAACYIIRHGLRQRQWPGFQSMMKHLPPLNALRAFEAVARHKRFVRAAGELCVTHGAVSKQIRQLEEHYGVRLFDRTAAQVELTVDGQRILRQVAAALDLIAETRNALGGDPTEGVLSVLSAPGFAAHWLIPRLAGFTERHPKIRINLETSRKAESAYETDADLAILFGHPSWPDRSVILLKDLTLFPVCSPKLIAGSSPLRYVSDLRQHTLLHEDDGTLWSSWLASNRVTTIDGYRGHNISDVVHLLIAACEGCGVALGDDMTSMCYLRSGALVRPFQSFIRSPLSYYVVSKDEASLPARSKLFLTWLRQEIDAD